jgi:hypothetical protein
MTLYEFRLLDMNEQTNLVWDGVFLDVRIKLPLSILLYDLGGFYVEVHYNSMKNGIVRLRSFKSTSCLQPYLDQLTTEELNDLI